MPAISFKPFSASFSRYWNEILNIFQNNIFAIFFKISKNTITLHTITLHYIALRYITLLTYIHTYITYSIHYIYTIHFYNLQYILYMHIIKYTIYMYT
jgi:hypothetical protein